MSIRIPLAGPQRLQRAVQPALIEPVVWEMMREFVERQRQAREYDAFLRAKCETAPVQIASGQVASSAHAEAGSAARRVALRAKAGG